MDEDPLGDRGTLKDLMTGTKQLVDFRDDKGLVSAVRQICRDKYHFHLDSLLFRLMAVHESSPWAASRGIPHHFPVQIRVSLNHALQSEFPAAPVSARHVPWPPRFASTSKVSSRVRNRRIARPHQKSVLAGLHQFGNPPHLGGDHGQAGRHRFHYGKRIPLPVRSQHKNIRGGQNARNVVSFAKQVNSLAEIM